MSRNMNSDPDEKRQKLISEIEETVTSPVHIMAFCSGYRVTFQKYHLHRLLPKQIHIYYGAGCPACLSSPAFIDKLVEEVFETDDAEWTGFGKIKDSGFKIKRAYRVHNAEEIFFDVKTPEPILPEGCLCGEIMRGVKAPADCPHFAKSCNPINAVGACMYSGEGPCRVDFLFGR